ncbi:MAG TPA: ZIP family metal transporter [archaeon]|nr:ZIP family metal transporter [archaeon]
MFEAWLYSLLSVILVSMISLIGVFTLAIKDSTLNKILLYFVSFSAGALLGDAFIHLLPETIKDAGFTVQISSVILFGIVFSFVVEKVVQWRHCHLPVSEQHPHPFAYMNLFGDGVHNFIDGLIIGASYIASAPIGIATTLAVIFHEIPQEIGDFGVLLHGGFKKRKALFMNFLTALTAVAGTVVALFIGAVEGAHPYLLAFAAGGFIYIASTDLIPELHRKNVCEGFSRDAFVQMVFLVLGMAVMYGLLLVAG